MDTEEKQEITPTDSPEANPLTLASAQFVSKKCEVCMSPLRTEVEALFDQGQKPEAIRRYFEERQIAIAHHKIRYHFEAHYKNQITQMAAENYAESCAALMKRRKSTLSNMDMLIASGFMEMARASGLQTNGDIYKEQIRQKMVADAHKMVIAAEQIIVQVEDKDARVRAVEAALEKVWLAKLEASKDDGERKLLITTLQDFKVLISQTKIES